MLLLARFRIVGHSMEPQIKTGETILASGIPYWFKTPKINDIVAFEEKGDVLIKRIVRIAGDRYFIQGDNKKDSLDSRKFGFISRKQILGKVFYK